MKKAVKDNGKMIKSVPPAKLVVLIYGQLENLW
jgi:hypothetical protein